jgi:serine/threonine protein kinase
VNREPASADDATPVRSSAPLANARTLPIGTCVEEFEITGLVGEGGFGVVYLALDRSLERRVAVKEYLPWSLAARLEGSTTVSIRTEQDAETFGLGLRSFVNEARLLAQFDHAALVKVHRFWESNGTAYMAMPFYEGPTLKQALANQSTPPDETWLRKILDPLLDALSVLHAAHCYHRDISPDNILLTTTGPVLLDFGAARRVISDASQMLTVILKDGYAPVEQYGTSAAMRQGPWTDIYALSTVMRYAITGQKAASAVDRLLQDPMQALMQIASGRYTASFLSAIDAGMAVRPEERPQSIAEFRSLMDAAGSAAHEPFDATAATRLRPSPAAPRIAAQPDSIPARTHGSSPPDTPAGILRKIPTWAVALLGGVAIICIAVAVLLRPGPRRSPPRSPATASNTLTPHATSSVEAGPAVTVSPPSASETVMKALQAEQTSLTSWLTRARSVIISNGGNPAVALAQAMSAAQRASDATAAGDWDEALTETRNATAASKAETRGFLEDLSGKYATIAQRKMNEGDLSAAQMAIDQGRALKRMESSFQ